MNSYNKEDVMKEFDYFLENWYISHKAYFIDEDERNCELFKSKLSTALDAAFQAGDESRKQKIRDLIEDGRYIADEIVEEALK